MKKIISLLLALVLTITPLREGHALKGDASAFNNSVSSVIGRILHEIDLLHDELSETATRRRQLEVELMNLEYQVDEAECSGKCGESDESGSASDSPNL
ncbi:MAG: hypothetical protein LBL71_02875, partial [Endomicrobium sp.]|nr:hypothetical protein [Endomicrobium sp.]